MLLLFHIYTTILSIINNSMEFCTYYIPKIESTISSFIDACTGRKIVSLKMIQDDYCLLTYPCQGHVGIRVTFTNGEHIDFACPSTIMIGVIFHFCNAENRHCTSYLTEEVKTIIEDLRKNAYGNFEILSA